MRIILVGPGRAGLSVARAASAGGHEIVGVLGRSPADQAARQLDSVALSWDELLPAADLLLIAVRDDAIGEVADRLAARAIGVRGAVHLSGSLDATVLEPIARPGIATGTFHPLQTLPDPETGSRRLAGAWVGISATDPGFREVLTELAASLSMTPFDLSKVDLPLYHAGAAAAANYVVASLALAERLFGAAGAPWEAAAPLVRAVTENALTIGPGSALTGPIARGDISTVRRQVAAITAAAPELRPGFTDMGRAVARLAGREEEFREVFE
ncbi:MAG: DUF2520 domain-containing protein [Acidimicrobiia bacterium]|nr:DUF2520 domain-containing protein [Acidimicrobiia bacterium]